MRIMFLNQAPKHPKISANDAEYDGRVKALLDGYASPGTQIDLSYPDDYEGGRVARESGSQDVHTELPYYLSTPNLVRKAVWAQENGYDALIQSNGFDPGVEATRLAVRIPVIGICKTVMHVAATLADRIGVTAPFDGYAIFTRRLLQTYGLLGFVTDVRSLSLHGGVPQGDQVDASRGPIFERAVEVFNGLVRETGAECIVPLGGAIIPYIVSPDDLAKAVGVPVLNTKAIAIRMAEMYVNLGMSHSERTYPTAKLRATDFEAKAFAAAAVGSS